MTVSFAVGLLLVGIAYVPGFASGRTRKALAPFRLTPDPLLYHPGNALTPYLSSTYTPEARDLLKRFRRQTLASVVVGLLGALTMALSL